MGEKGGKGKTEKVAATAADVNVGQRGRARAGSWGADRFGEHNRAGANNTILKLKS